MKKRFRRYFKLNLVSMFFIAVSFISVTLAWFAYSGLANVQTEVNVRAWYIELSKDGEKVSNDIVISLDEIYPGMDLVSETIKIQNMGDSDAQVRYEISSARILNEYDYHVDGTTVTTEYVEDMLSHNFPFNINIDLSKKFSLAKGDESIFEVSISWPLDADTDEFDSEWGNKAYEFYQNEEAIHNQNADYKIRSSLQVEIALTAEQYLENPTTSDTNYTLGDEILVDVMTKQRCATLSTTCLKTYVFDVNNTLGDETVTLFPNPLSTYLTGTYNDYSTIFTSMVGTWQVGTKPIKMVDIMKVISKDVKNSVLIRENYSDAIIGNLSYGTRIDTELSKLTNYNGYYRYMNTKFGFSSANDCYWVQDEYNVDNGIAVERISDVTSKVFGNAKTNSCKIIPLIVANKADL